MTLVTQTQDLQEALKSIESTDSFVTIDTEFLREETIELVFVWFRLRDRKELF